MNSERKILDNETRAMADKKFPLPPKQSEEFESKRTLVGLFKQGPLETTKEFALRVWKANQDYLKNSQAKTPSPTSAEKNSA
jgi:hypothetical protein